MCVPYVDNFINGMDSEIKKNLVGVAEGEFYPPYPLMGNHVLHKVEGVYE